MSMSSLRFRPLARQALINLVGADTPTEHKITDGFNTLNDQLLAALQRLFGPDPIHALVARSQQLAEQDYAFLRAILRQENGRLHAALEGQQRSPDELLAALSAVLAHEIDLLTVLVGEDFVMPLVTRAWPVSSGGRPSH